MGPSVANRTRHPSAIGAVEEVSGSVIGGSFVVGSCFGPIVEGMGLLHLDERMILSQASLALCSAYSGHNLPQDHVVGFAADMLGT